MSWRVMKERTNRKDDKQPSKYEIKLCSTESLILLHITCVVIGIHICCISRDLLITILLNVVVHKEGSIVVACRRYLLVIL